MSEIELKACPFCGGEAGIRKWQDEDLWSHAIVEWQKAHCTECECEGISSCPGYDPDTVQAWNTRAPQWQPISSAPKDGRPMLLDHPGWHTRVLRGAWDAHELAWRVHGIGCPATQPTKWQPLPAPPEESP